MKQVKVSETAMITVFKTIQQAVDESDFNFFVITDTEIHGHTTEDAAQEDVEALEQQLEHLGITDMKITLCSRVEAEKSIM